MKSTTKAMNLEQGTELFKKISRLIPWELTRVQVAVTPMARRLPRDINYSHRGAVLLLSDGKMMIEVEDVRQVQFPKARFENPISAAIFFYGLTEEDAPPQGQPAPEDPLLPVVGLRTDITFPGIPLNVSKEVRASNAGHPSKQELKRLLAAHGALNLPVVTALEHIKCGSCERTAKHLQPRPAALPTFQGRFGLHPQPFGHQSRGVGGLHGDQLAAGWAASFPGAQPCPGCAEADLAGTFRLPLADRGGPGRSVPEGVH